MPENENLLLIIRQTPCAECGKLPSQGAHIREIEEGTFAKFYNLMPLCVTHVHEHDRIGTIAMSNKYRNLRKYIERKGWQSFEGKFTHRDLKGEN